MGTWIVLLVAIGFGVARFIVPVTGDVNHADIFKDLAHVFVGGLFGAAIKGTARNRQDDFPLTAAFAAEWRLWAMAWGLTILEVAAFFIRKG